MKVRLIAPEVDYLNDVQEVPRAFAPYLEVDPEAESFFQWDCSYSDGVFRAEIKSDAFGTAEGSVKAEDGDILLFKKTTKRFLKNFLYDFLSEKLDVKLPYGSLTGVRPTKLYYELSSQSNPLRVLKEEFRVSERRARLIEECVKNQRGVINTDPSRIAFFLNVPFCPTRCAYCSFISTEVGRVKKELPRYVDCLVKETEIALHAASEAGKTVSSVYIGGGTPACIGGENLSRICEPFKNLGVEFTVEAGRPDVIDDEVVQALAENNVTRVSVNPQTFIDGTLSLIGRQHTSKQIFEAYEKVKDKFSVNMDLIAGLPGESERDFAYSLSQALTLCPDNVTVHALSLKRGSVMTVEGAKKNADGSAKVMSDYAMDELERAGYAPYYMYRQKNTADNLENVGYALYGKQCRYNIDMMEESATVLGVGAGSMSKLVSQGRIERLSDPKGLNEYLGRIEEIYRAKEAFFKR